MGLAGTSATAQGMIANQAVENMNFAKQILAILLTVWTWVFIAFSTILLVLIILLLKPFDRDQKISYRIPNLWGYLISKCNPFWHTKVIGADSIQDNQGYVLVANHKSVADITSLHLLQTHFKWVAKESLFRIPIFGWGMSLVNYIPLRRGDIVSIKNTYSEAIKWLNKDVSVLIFPEGTRIKEDKLGNFKNGAFKLALETRKPVIPIVIYGTNKALKKGQGKIALSGNMSVTVLPPIETTGYALNEFAKLREDVRAAMDRQYMKDREK